jgi:hypothetical protein
MNTTNADGNKLLRLPITKPDTPLSLEGVAEVLSSGGVTYRVRKHSLGLCVGCDFHLARLCDVVRCYDKERPNETYSLSRVGLPPRQPKKLGT